MGCQEKGDEATDCIHLKGAFPDCKAPTGRDILAQGVALGWNMTPLRG